MRYNMNEKDSAYHELQGRWYRELRWKTLSPEFAYSHNIWSLNSGKSLTFSFCVYGCFVHILVSVFMLTITKPYTILVFINSDVLYTSFIYIHNFNINLSWCAHRFQFFTVMFFLSPTYTHFCLASLYSFTYFDLCLFV